MQRLFYWFACVSLFAVCSAGAVTIGYLAFTGGRMVLVQTEASEDLRAVLNIVNSGKTVVAKR